MSQVMRSLEEQHEFNLARWEEIEKDPEVAAWPGRVETDREGNVIMIPPSDAGHGFGQAKFIALFARYLPHGLPIGEFAVSTSEGNKAPDCGWVLATHPELKTLRDNLASRKLKVFKEAPDICVEILSENNSAEEIALKKRLYFVAGAKEVWVCGLDGSMEFFDVAGKVARSRLCPRFPRMVSFLTPPADDPAMQPVRRQSRRIHPLAKEEPGARDKERGLGR
jgi:Uma2 family endonuclease